VSEHVNTTFSILEDAKRHFAAAQKATQRPSPAPQQQPQKPAHVNGK
jgi:hypothetical protein